MHLDLAVDGVGPVTSITCADVVVCDLRPGFSAKAHDSDWNVDGRWVVRRSSDSSNFLEDNHHQKSLRVRHYQNSGSQETNLCPLFGSFGMCLVSRGTNQSGIKYTKERTNLALKFKSSKTLNRTKWYDANGDSGLQTIRNDIQWKLAIQVQRVLENSTAQAGCKKTRNRGNINACNCSTRFVEGYLSFRFH